jgi:glycosyltransferase involved in cell wall biosynthesis
VVLVGRVSQAEVRDIYGLLDVLVLPRRRMRLTELVTPLKPLEAMAMAKTVLASDVGGHAELIRHEETGMLFPAESRDALVSQAVRLGKTASLRRDLGEAGQRYVSGQHTWDGLVRRYLPLYQGAV